MFQNFSKSLRIHYKIVTRNPIEWLLFYLYVSEGTK